MSGRREIREGRWTGRKKEDRNGKKRKVREFLFIHCSISLDGLSHDLHEKEAMGGGGNLVGKCEIVKLKRDGEEKDQCANCLDGRKLEEGG